MAKIRSLKHCPLFSGLDYRELGVVASLVKEETCETGALLAGEGVASDGLILLEEGRLKLGSTFNEQVSIELGPGDFFGEASVVSESSTRHVRVEALENCSLLRFSSRAFRSLAKETPATACKIATHVVEHLVAGSAQAKEAIQDVLQKSCSA